MKKRQRKTTKATKATPKTPTFDAAVLEMLNPNAAGIDVSSEDLWGVCQRIGPNSTSGSLASIRTRCRRLRTG